MVSTNVRDPETKDGLVRRGRLLQCAANKLQVWIFSKRLFVIFGTSREAGGDYREEEEVDVLCSPPVKEEKQEEKQEEKEKEKLCSPPVKRRSRRIKRK